VKKVLLVKRNFEEINISKNDVIYNDLIESQSEICDFEKLDSEDTSFILYTSGSTGKPK
jgi:acetate--coA ligase